MFPIFFSEISGMFPTVLTFPEKFASLITSDRCRMLGREIAFERFCPGLLVDILDELM